MNMVYSALHRRALSEALAGAAVITLDSGLQPDVPDSTHNRSFALALDDLCDAIVPRFTDQQASAKAKGVARLIHWRRDRLRYQPALHAAETAEFAAVLGQEFIDHASAWTAWAAFCEAVRSSCLLDDAAIRLYNACVSREAMLMADVMGGLAEARFAPSE